MRKTITKILLLIAAGVVALTDGYSQCPFPILTGASTSGNARCPIGNFRYERGHYVITAAEMAAGGYTAGSSISFVRWTYATAASVPVTGNLAVYFENTADVSNLKSTTWATAISTMTNSRPSAAFTLPGTPTLTFDVPITIPFLYTGGGLYVAYEWSNAANPLSTLAVVQCNTVMPAPAIYSAQSNVALPATMPTASAFRPVTTFFGPAIPNDAQAALIQGLGNMAVGYTTNYSIRANIYNPGTTTLTSLPVTLNISGANTFSNVQTIASLAPCASTIVTFSGFTPTVVGSNTVTVSVPLDGNNSNNSTSYTMTTSKDITSYRYVAPVTGGVGFNGGTGDFLGKFTAANNFGNPDTINGFEVIFTSTGQPYNVGVWTDVAGSPGVNIYTSPSQTTIQDTVFISLPDIEVSGSYWVGIRQTGTTNVGFGYQAENPVRSTEFKYTSPTGGTTWTDFSPGANFRITATVQYKTPQPPNCAVYLSPANAAVACQNGVTLNYGSGGGGPTGYRVYFGTNQALVEAEDPGTLVQNSAATSYATGILSPSTTYYWRVTAYNLNGDASGCATLSRSFSTNLVSCYCASTATNGAFEHITNVSSGSFSNSTASNLYSNYTGLGVINNVNIGATFNINVTIDPSQVYDEDRILVFVDFNHDGDWNDLGELCGNVDVTIAGGNVYTVPCTVPGNALSGNTLLRIKFGDEVSTTAMSLDPCQVSYTFGEVEDYLLNITCGAAASSNTPVCENSTLNLTSTYLGLGTPVSFSWTTTAANGFTSGSQNPSLSNVTPANDAGNYTVVITDNNGCTSSATVTVAVSPAPTPTASSNAPVCEGSSLNLSSSNIASGQGSGNSFSWGGPNGFTSSQQNPPVTSNATSSHAGIYTVTITNSFLCTASASTNVVINQNPIPSIASQVDVDCIGQCNGQADIDATGGLSPYLFDDGSTFNIDGVFNTLCEGNTIINITDANNCSATITVTLGHQNTAPPSASVVVPPIIGLPGTACNGTTATISIPSVTGATSYIWDGPSGTTFNSGFNPYSSATPTANITFGNPSGSGYYIGVQAANGCGVSVRKVQWVRNQVSVPLAITGPVNVCPSSTDGPYNTTTSVGAVSWLWTLTGDATFVSNGLSTITTAVPNPGLMINLGAAFTSGTLCVAAQTSCFTSSAKCINLSKTSSQPGVMSGVFNVCPGSSQTFSVPNVSGGSYNWTLPGNATGSSTTNSITVNFLSGFTGGNICVTYTNACGETSVARCKTVNIGSPTVPASITGPTNGLCGQSVTYTCPAQGGATFNWTLPAGSSGSSSTNSISATLPGAGFTTGQVCVSATNGCGTSAQRCITVKGAPLTPGTITPNPSTWCDNQAGIQFSANTSLLTGSFALNWSWLPASAATYVSGQGTPVLNVDWNTGNASVNLTASNACGNATKTYSAASTCRESQPDNSIPAIVNAEGKFSVYPNPAIDLLNIDFAITSVKEVNVVLMDITGRSVVSKLVSVTDGINHTTLDVSKIAKGAYMLKVENGDVKNVVRVVIE